MFRTTLRGRTVRSALLGSVLLAVGGAAGCKLFATKLETSQTGSRGQDRGDACDQMPDKPMPAAELPACDGAHQIAVNPTGTCPDVQRDIPGGITTLWTGHPVFEGSSGKLARYCQYSWTGEGAPDTSSLLTAGITGASEDCTFITPQQPTPPTPPADFTSWAYDMLLLAAKRTVGAAPHQGNVRTRVTVLDTSPAWPTGQIQRGDSIRRGSKSNHGETLGRLIKAIACENPSDCPIDVRTRLVMPWYVERGGSLPTARRDDEGGNVGRLEDLAIGMWAEIAAYRNELEKAARAAASGDVSLAKKTPTQLVFNESFAWGDFNGTDQCNEHPHDSSDAVVQALVMAFDAAACVGAVHVSAAGNHTGGLVLNRGLMCPAKWHHEIHPDQEACEAILGKVQFEQTRANFKQVLSSKGELDRPIWEAKKDVLISVGGTDFDRHPIVMSRPDACPDVAAVGISGTAQRDPATNPAGSGGDAYFPFLFGTSVSTAVVSGNLAATWYAAAPSVSPPDAVLAMIKGSGDQTAEMNQRGACGCSGETACNVPWIGNLGGCSPGSQNPQPSSDVMSTVTARPVQLIDPMKLDPTPVCPSKVPLCAADSASAAPGVWPVPVEPACTQCTLFLLPGSTTTNPNPTTWGLSIDRNPLATNIQRATLVVYDMSGQEILTTALSPTLFSSSSTTSSPLTSLVTIAVPHTLSLTGARAMISAYNTSGESVTQQIFVIQ